MLIVAGFAMSFLGLVVFKHVGPKLGLVDRPNLRSHHSKATVLGGGFVVALVFVILLLIAADTGQLMLSDIGGLASTMLILALMGLADDRFDLPILPRLMAYCLALWIFDQHPISSLPMALTTGLADLWGVDHKRYQLHGRP